MEKVRVAATIWLVVYGGTFPPIFAQDADIEITPALLDDLRKGVIEIGGIRCGIQSYDRKKNLFIVGHSVGTISKKECADLITHGWIANEENLKQRYLPSE